MAADHNYFRASQRCHGVPASATAFAESGPADLHIRRSIPGGHTEVSFIESVR
jgi:hypothetical protein